MKFSIIVAMAENNVIGLNNSLPWHLPEDLKRVKSLTMNHPLVMGRKTFESNSSTILENDYSEVFIFGGGDIFKQFLPICDILYITLVNAEIKGDTFFPSINYSHWCESKRESFGDFDFITLTRIMSEEIS